MDLAARFDELEKKTECLDSWPSFFDKVMDESFGTKSISEQVTVLDEFCKSPCGYSFNKEVGELMMR